MKRIDWLDNFAESYSKMNKTASKKTESIIVDRTVVKSAKLGDKISFNNKTYKVADLNYVDEKGEGAVLDEVGYGEGIPENDPMSIAMGAPVMNFTEGMTAPEYSRVDPGNAYDIPVEENFEDAANATEQQIANENAVDRTTVENHFKKNDLNQGVAIVETPVEINGEPIETPVEEPIEEVSLEDNSTEEVPTEEITEEVIDDATNEVNEAEEVEEAEEKIEEDDSEEEFIDPSKVESFRHNRILRRIMGSK